MVESRSLFRYASLQENSLCCGILSRGGHEFLSAFRDVTARSIFGRKRPLAFVISVSLSTREHVLVVHWLLLSFVQCAFISGPNPQIGCGIAVHPPTIALKRQWTHDFYSYSNLPIL